MVRGLTPFFISCTLALALMTPGVVADPGADKISIFIIGGTHPTGNPITGYCMHDPLFSHALEPIPPDLSDGDKQKLDRIYYPRTRKVLVENFDMIVFNDARLQHFTPRQLSDLDYAFREAGMGSFATFGPAWEQVWEVTTLYDTSPAKDYTDEWFHGVFYVRFHRDREPIFTPFVELGMEKVLGDAYHLMVEKQGAVVWGDMLPRNTPWMISWRPGGTDAGLQWVCTDGFNALWWGISGWGKGTGTTGIEGGNPYAIDMTTNLILYSVGRTLISDIHARREARHLLSSFNEEKILILHMMDWADTFGANTMPLTLRLASLETEVGVAVQFYLEEDYGNVISLMNEITTRTSEITSDTVKLKDQAMFWVFISEWLIVTSAGILSGLVLWSLMIRRSVYREVGGTRLGEVD